MRFTWFFIYRRHFRPCNNINRIFYSSSCFAHTLSCPPFFHFSFWASLIFFYFYYYLWPGAPAKFYWLALCDCSAGTHKRDWHIQRPSPGRQLIKNEEKQLRCADGAGMERIEWKTMKSNAHRKFRQICFSFFFFSFFKYKRNQKKGKPKLDG